MNLAKRVFRGVRRPDALESALPLGALAFALFVCLTFIALDASNALDQRRHEIENALRDAANLARSLAQHTEDTFRAADVSIVGPAQRVQMEGTGRDTTDPLVRIMAARLAMFPGLANTIIVDAAGACVASGRPLPPGDCHFGDTENFAYHRAHADKSPHLGPPIRGSASGAWVIPISRRFDRDGGAFGGIVVGTVGIQRIKEFYDTFNIGETGTILLASAAGRLLVRRPLADGDIGRDMTQSPLFRDLLPAAPIGSAELASLDDGAARLVSYRAVSEFPLVVSVAFDKDELLAPWAADLHSRLMRTGGLIVIIGALGTWLAIRIRRHQQLETTHRNTAAAFRLLAENSSDLIVRLGPDMRRLYVSPASRELLGYEPDELLGRRTDDIVHPDDRALWETVLGPASRTETSDIEATYRVRRKDGATIWVEVYRRRLASGDGFVVSTRDVTRRKVAEDQLTNANRRLTLMANHDGLTGLANRRHFDETLEFEVRRAKREGAPLSLVMIDVDRFKAFNDRYGHPAGDHCLREIARALEALPGRPADLVARYGGEELAILLPNTPQSGALMVAERARSAVRSLAIAHEDSEAKIITVSLGVATLLPTAASGEGEDLVSAADRALYAAKAAGRDRVCQTDDVPETLLA